MPQEDLDRVARRYIRADLLVKVIDADFDGRLTGSDMVLVRLADGGLELRTIGEQGAAKARVAAAIVDASYEVAGANFGFATKQSHEANKTFFIVESNGVFVLRPGYAPSAALSDFFENPRLYDFECETAKALVYFRAIQKLLGDEDFDRLFPSLRIGPGIIMMDIPRETHESTDAEERLLGADSYVDNPDVSEKGKAEGWSGENAFYLGNGMYFGHPFGIAHINEIVAYLNHHRIEKPTQSARLESKHYSLSPSIVERDWLSSNEDYNHGLGLWNVGDFQGAVTSLRRAVERDPRDGQAWLQLARALGKAEQMGQLSGVAVEIVDCLRRAVELGAMTAHRFAPDTGVDDAPPGRGDGVMPGPNEFMLQAALANADLATMEFALQGFESDLRRNRVSPNESLVLSLLLPKLRAMADAADNDEQREIAGRILTVIDTVRPMLDKILLIERSWRAKREIHFLPQRVLDSLQYQVRIAKIDLRSKSSVSEALIAAGSFTADLAGLRFDEAGRVEVERTGPNGEVTVIAGSYSVDDTGRLTIRLEGTPGETFSGGVDSTGVLIVKGLGEFTDSL